MYVLELALQGVRGFSPVAKVVLKSGFLALRPPAGATDTPLCGLLLALCFSDGRGGDASFRAPGQKSAKAGLTLVGKDGVTYRVVRELGGGGALHRMNKGAGQFEVVSQDAAEISQYLRSQVGLPTKSALEQVFCFTPRMFPSKHPRSKPTAGSPAAPKPALAQAQPVSGDLATLRSKLAELKREHALSKQVDELQFRQDGIASELFGLESTLRGGEGLKAAIQEAEAAYESAPTPEALNLPKDLLERIERYPTLVQKRDEALAKLDAEREGAASSEGPAAVDPLYRDVRFWAAVAAGVGALALGSQLSGYLRYVALLDIPAFGFAALVALRYVEELQAGTRVSRKGDFLATREKKIREEFDAEVCAVKDAMAAVGVESPGELVELFSRKPLLLEKVRELKQQLGDLELDPSYASASARFQQLKAEQEAINAKLLETGGYIRDVREVEREISRVEEAIAGQKAPAPAPAAELAFEPVQTDAAEVFEDPMPPLMALGADLFSVDVPTLGATLRDRAVQYFTALTDRRYHGIELDKDGRGYALAPGRRIPAGELPGKDLDLLYLSVRLTLVEKYSARLKVPVLIEDALGCVEEPKQPLLGRMLKHLGTLTQVLYVTATGKAADAADASVKI